MVELHSDVRSQLRSEPGGRRSQARSGSVARENRRAYCGTEAQCPKSVAEGVKEGWSRDRDKERIDLNTATREELIGTGLPRTRSDRLMEHRPYASPRELLTKHVLSEDEYRQIEPHVKAGEPLDK
jgi:hypothetical protein